MKRPRIFPNSPPPCRAQDKTSRRSRARRPQPKAEHDTPFRRPDRAKEPGDRKPPPDLRDDSKRVACDPRWQNVARAGGDAELDQDHEQPELPDCQFHHRDLERPIRDVRLLGTNVARRDELTRSKLLSRTVALGALPP
jgi:hypothetical protein